MRKKIKKSLSFIMVLTMVISSITFAPDKTYADTTDFGGTVVETQHNYENNICKTCGRVEDAQIGKTYSVKTTSKNLLGIVSFVAPSNGVFKISCKNTTNWDSYGYLYRAEDYDDQFVMDGIDQLLQSEGSTRYQLKGYEWSDDDAGENGAPAILAKVNKGQKYYFVVGPYYNGSGAIDITIDCAHLKTEVKNKTLESCEKGGYTGDVVCTKCNKVITTGENVEAGSSHEFSTSSKDATCTRYKTTTYTCIKCGKEKVEEDTEAGYGSHYYVTKNYKPATCTTDGYVGDEICIYCGDKKASDEDKVIKAFHYTAEGQENRNYIYNDKYADATCEKPGYAGDTVCRVCNEIIEKGKQTEALKHNIVDGVCTNCGVEKSVLDKVKNGYYEIGTVDELVEYLKISYSGINGKLVKDITFPENYQDEDNILGKNSGQSIIFDGNGHTITNANVKGNASPLFHSVSNSQIKNLNLKSNNAVISGMLPDLAQQAKGTIFTKCIVTGKKVLDKTKGNINAMVTSAERCEFKECKNNCDISGTGKDYDYIAGIVNEAESTVFEKCENNGNIDLNSGEAAGIVIYANNVILKDCKNTGAITVGDRVAGIVIAAESLYDAKCKITNCVNTGTLKSTVEAAGIVSDGENSEVTNCRNEAYIKANYASGISNYGSSQFLIDNCINNGIIKGLKQAAGIALHIDNSLTQEQLKIINCTNNGDIISNSSAAGIVDEMTNGIIDSCYNNGKIDSAEYAGGVISYCEGVKVLNSVNNGEIIGFGIVGGICGMATEGSEFDKIYNTGIVDSDNMALKKSLLTNGDDDITITGSEENHSHDYDTILEIKKATTTTDGKIVAKCKCGQTKETVINKVNTISLKIKQYKYTGKNIKLPVVTVKDSKGNVLPLGSYSVAYKNKKTGKTVKTIKNVGTYEIVVTLKGSYSGTLKASFTVVKSAKTNLSVKGLKLKAGKKTIKVKWNKVKGAKRYQIRYATNSKMKKAKTITVKSNKAVLKKLKKKKYFVQVRAYKVKKTKGKWSSKKSVKVK